MQQSRNPSLARVLDRPFALMGIVNVTPDSFYDGGRYATSASAVDHGMRCIDGGADVIDIGGESTRPGAPAVSVEEECRRVLDSIGELAKKSPVPISIDTTKAAVAERALDAGASWINDISAGRFDPDMPALAARRHCPVVLMHSRKRPATMQDDPRYEDVIGEIIRELSSRIETFTNAGVYKKNIIIDPGIGFAKRYDDNIAIINRCSELAVLGTPLLIGTSRKSFIGSITGKGVENRLWGSLASVASAWSRGVKIFRVHDVDETRDFLKVLTAIEEDHRF